MCIRDRLDADGIELPWHMIGVAKVGYSAEEVTEFPRGQVVGKAMTCQNVVNKWLPEWCQSKVDG